jgi:two-component sensor histidine kinase
VRGPGLSPVPLRRRRDVFLHFDGCPSAPSKNGQNAQVMVSLLKSEEGVLHLAVEDNGSGLSRDFDSTRNLGIVLQLVRGMTAQLHGALRPVLDDQRTRFEIAFPCRGGSA